MKLTFKMINNLIAWAFGALGWFAMRTQEYHDQVDEKTPYEKSQELYERANRHYPRG